MALAALVLLAGCKKQSSEKRITKFAFTSLNVEATILESTKIIKATVPMGTNVTALEPWIVVSSMASVSPASGVAQNFSRPVTYTVTAEDGSTASYIVSVVVGDTQSYNIKVSANPSNGGTVSGGGSYNSGQSCTVRATANSGYTFWKWTENGTQVSTDANYTFTVNGSRNLVAVFTSNGGGGGGGGTQEGMYVGVIGFNDELKTKNISLLNGSSQGSFTSFIDGLGMSDGTALYYADETALNWFQSATLPNDLFNVSLLTFTDGLDNASLMLNGNYDNMESYLNAVSNRIHNDRVKGKPINAYSIGLKGQDMTDEQAFQQTLGKLASHSFNVYLADNMDVVIQHFREIADQLYNEITTVNTNVKIPGGYDQNTTIRLTFDNVSNANNSSRYIQAVFSRENGRGKLDNINYYGLQSSSSSLVYSTSQAGSAYWYPFSDLKVNGQALTNLDNMKLWVYRNSSWQPESEFTPSNSTNTTATQKSTVAILVLDCTTSLGATDFNKMKDAAKAFITTLNANSGGGGGGGTQQYTINVSSNPTSGGTVSGGGTFNSGTSCTVTATANSGYTFQRWTVNGTQVSTNANYTFMVTGNRSLVAHFQQQTSDQTFTVNGVSFTMKQVQGGTFKMGAQSANPNGQNYDSEAYSNESPVHSVTLSTFYMGETEVTQELWQAVMGSNPSSFSGTNRPVEQVSWNMIVNQFIPALNALTGRTFRLPTEAEWEYAARGGNQGHGYKYAGSNTIGNVAWYYDNSGNQTHQVATKSPNELGLYDMSGNVWEWCQDWYGSYGSNTQTDPQGPSSGQRRVLRGGSWNFNASYCRVAGRGHYGPDGRGNGIGFRVVLVP